MPRRNRVSFVAVALAAGCAVEPAEEIGGRAAALTPVTWTEVVGASAAGNDLTKTAPETAFNAGAVSVQTLAGDGYVEFTTGEATADKVVGLSSGNGGQGLADIDFGIRLNAAGRASVWESGINRGGIGTYAAGQTFRVKAEDGVVTYYRNGVLRYTSAVAPSFPLLVDTSLRTPGATVQDVVIEPIDFWTAAVGVAVDGNDITKTAPDDAFNAGAVSIATIANGDGYVEFRVTDATTAKAAGLSNGNSNQGRGDIDFALYLSEVGGISVYEGGTKIGNFGLYDAGDTFQVEVSAGVVRYFRNRILFYTSLVAPTFPLLLDTSLRTPGTSIQDASVVVGAVVPDCAPFAQSLFGAEPGERLGFEFQVAGDVLVATSALDARFARVYRRGPGGWTFEQNLPDIVAATDGQTIAVGGGPRPVQLYRHDGDQWSLDGTIVACPGDFHRGVAISGDVVIVGGEGQPERYASIYRRDASGWQLDGVLTSGLLNDSFGSDVAIAGDRAFVAARFDDAVGTDAGALYVFRYVASLPSSEVSCSDQNRGKWRLKDVLRPSNAAAEQLFPLDMDVNAAGDRLIGGTYGADTAHVFDLAGGVWSETAVLRPFPFSNQLFGWTVALGGPDDSVAVVGTLTLNPDADAIAFVFANQAGGWRGIDVLLGPDAYGQEVAASADEIFVGNEWDDSNGTTAGAIHVHGIEPVCLQE